MIEELAMADAKNNTPRPPDDLMDCFLYLALYSLYATYYNGLIPRETASQAKKNIVRQHEKVKAKYDADMRMVYADVRWRTGVAGALTRYAKERTMENADRLWAAVNDLFEGVKPYGR